MNLQSIPNQLLFTTVRIECQLSNGSSSIGTGFFFNYSVGSTQYLFLVTNKHVVAGATRGSLFFTVSDGDKPRVGSGFEYIADRFEEIWFGHADPKIDIAVTPFVPLLQRVEQSGTRLFYTVIGRELIPGVADLEVLSVLEQIVFVGYPSGLWDRKHLLPIVRTGVTATSPAIDFQGEAQFVVDASVFPGSSGSPVFLYNNGSFTDGAGNIALGGRRLYFLGVIASVFSEEQISPIQIVSHLPGTAVAVSKQMIDLGIVFKARAVEEAVEQFARAAGMALVERYPTG